MHTTSDFKCTPMSSDHVAITFSIHSLEPHEIQYENASHNYKLADWNMYRGIIHYHAQFYDIDNIHTTADIDMMIDKSTKLLNHAKNRAVPKTTKNKFKLILTDEIRQQIIIKNSLRREWQRSRNLNTKRLLNFIENEIKILVNNLRNDSWEEKLSDITPSNQAVWETSRKLKNSKSYMPPLVNEEKIIITAQEKAEIIGEVFYRNHINPMNENDPVFAQQVEGTNQNFTEEIHPTCNEYTDEIEVRSIIKRLKNRKAPGLDEISNNLIKKLPSRGIKMLVTIFNGCLKLSYFPACWKLAKVVAIHKPGKDASKPESYRPISLLCTLSKILERIILIRFQRHLDENEILPDEQNGFRANRSTTRQLDKLIKTAKAALNQKQSMGIVMLDVEKAFDRVWHEGLIYKLISLGFPAYIVKIIREFLSNRTFRVHVNGFSSAIHEIKAGVPQGAVLSPTLYNTYTYDIPKNAKTTTSLFADDTAIYASSALLKDVIKPIKEHAQQIQDYMTKWKIKINEDKTQAIYITRRRTKEIPKRKLKIFNKNIAWTNEAKYLGVMIDKKVTLKQHIDYVIKKTNVAINTLYPLINRKSKLCLQNKLLIYKVAIRPIFTYACPAFTEIAKTHIKRLQVQQNKVLKMILDTSRYERTDAIHEMAQV